MSSATRDNLLMATATTAVIVLAYAPGLTSNNFVFDDLPAIAENVNVVSLNISNVFLRHDFWGNSLTSKSSHKSYRPLTTLLFFLINQVFKKNSAWVIHILNVVIHCINVELLRRLITSKVTSKRANFKIAWLTSMLFALHPVHVEPVASCVGLADLSSSLVVLYALRKKGANFACLLIASVMAVLLKEPAMMLPLLSLLLHPEKGRRKLTVQGTQCIFVAGLIVFYRLWVVNFEPPVFNPKDNPQAFIPNMTFRLINRLYLYTFNLWLLVAPDWLCHDWAMGCVPLIESFFDYRLCLSLLVALCLSFLVFKALSNAVYLQNYLYFDSLVLIAVPFFPASNIVFNVGFVVAERNLYLSTAGFTLLVSCGLHNLTNYLPKRVLQICVGFLLIAHGLKCHLRGWDWLEERRLFVSGLKVCPNNAKILYNLAKTSDEDEVAIALYHKAVQLQPDYEHAMNNLGNLLRRKDQVGEAEQLLLRAVEISPKFGTAWLNLGVTQTTLGKLDEAEQSYLKALQLRGTDCSNCHFNLGNLYLKRGDQSKAAVAFQQALIFEPSHFKARSNLVMVLQELSLDQEAEKVAREGILLDNNNSRLYFLLGNLLGRAQRFPEAEESFLKAITISDAPEYFISLGVLYQQWGELYKAVDAYKEALRRDPSNAKCKGYLEKALERLGRNQVEI